MTATAWPKTATAAMAPYCVSEFGACTACGHPVHTVGQGSAVHTATGLFSCSDYPFGQAEIDPQPDQDATNAAVEVAVSNIRAELRRAITRWRSTADLCAHQRESVDDLIDVIKDVLDD